MTATEYLYVSPKFDGIAFISTDALAETTERHWVDLEVSAVVAGDPIRTIEQRRDLAGVVIGLTSGLPDRVRLAVADAALRRGLRLWLHWPNEQAVECVDA